MPKKSALTTSFPASSSPPEAATRKSISLRGGAKSPSRSFHPAGATATTVLTWLRKPWLTRLLLDATNPGCRLYASVGEFSPNRLDKVLTNCPSAQPRGALTAAVHFAPQLITAGLGENGRMVHLRNLEWLIGETFSW